jgi:hypothetical protein
LAGQVANTSTLRGSYERASDRRTPASISASPISEHNARCQCLGLDPLPVTQQVTAGWEGQHDPIGQLQARILAHGVDSVNELIDPASDLEVRIELRVESDRQRSVVRDGPELPRSAVS